MSDDHEFGPAVAGTTLTDDHPMGIDPEPDTDDGSEPAPVWVSSQRLREVIDRQEPRPAADGSCWRLRRSGSWWRSYG